MILKFALFGFLAVVIAGLAAGGYWWMTRPQVILLKDGTKLTLIGTTYGKHHVAPKIKINGKLTRGQNGGGQIDSGTNNTLVVWLEVEHKVNNQYPNYQLYVYDKANTACVGTYSSTQSTINNKITLMGYMFNAYPRWDSSMIVRVMSNVNGNRRLAKEQFVVANPKRVSIPSSKEEVVPDKKTDGDLSVTLAKLEYGVRGFNGISSAKDPMGKAVLAVFHFDQNGIVATNWQPIRIETSDASGNRAQNYSWSTGRDANGDGTMTYQWGLWPNQPWKLNVEMSKTAGFNSDEVWSITNLPVAPGNQSEMWNYNNGSRRTPPAFAETTLNGIHLKIYPAIQFTNYSTGNREKPGGFRVQADKSLDGIQLTLASATDENGRPIQFYGGNSWGGVDRQIQFQDLRNAKSLNLSLAMNKSRFFEFTVKPSKQISGNSD